MNKRLDQKGAVSLISVVIFSTLITVLVTAYLRSAVVQQSEALNYDLSTRAFYAAESGVQDTVRKLIADGVVVDSATPKEECNPSVPALNTNINLEYTCQRYSIEPTSITGSVSVNKRSALIKLDPSSNVDPAIGRLVLRWSKAKTADSTEPTLHPRSLDVPYLSSLDKWYRDNDPSLPVHAMLRVAVISTPKTNITTANTLQRVSFFNPTDSDNDGNVNFRLADNSLQTQQIQLFNNAQCYASDNVPDSALMSDGESKYSCRQVIDLAGYNFSNSDVYLKVSSLYRDTDFSMQLLNNTTVTTIKNAQVAIDITARAGGNVHRRVVQKVPLANFKIVDTKSDGIVSSDAALIAGEGICKNFVIAGTSASYQEGCNPLEDD